MAEVHQFIPSFVPRDAQGAHVIKVQRVLRGMGIASEIYAADIGQGVGARARHYRSFARRRRTTDTWLLYQLSTGNRLADWVLDRPEPKIVNYHNITPSELIAPWDPAVAVETAAGRRQLAKLAPVTDLAIAVSRFNERELLEAGYRATAVVPLFAELGGPERSTTRKESPVRNAGARWLFVGRLVPNKCHHDLVKALAAYRRLYDPAAELVLVGKPTLERYTAALHAFVHELGLSDAVRFEGSVSPDGLARHHRAADVVVCLSDHEGFWAPGIEAMLHGVPVVAFAAGAVPETLGDAALILPNKSPTLVATAVNRVLTDDALRQSLIAAGSARACEFSTERTAGRLRSVISEFLHTHKR